VQYLACTRTPSCACWARHRSELGGLGRCRACFFGGKPSSTASRLQRHLFLKRAAPGASALALRAPSDAPGTAFRSSRQPLRNRSAEQEPFRISDRRRRLVSVSQRRSQQEHGPRFAVLPARVRMEDFAVKLAPVKSQDALVRVAGFRTFPARVHHVRDDLVRKARVPGCLMFVDAGPLLRFEWVMRVVGRENEWVNGGPRYQLGSSRSSWMDGNNGPRADIGAAPPEAGDAHEFKADMGG
jgi:hypothetical protein